MTLASRYSRKTKTHQRSKSRQLSRRRLRLEQLEDRRLLAVLLADSFEQGEWNGNWVEDGQNDWARRSQRSADGSYSAEVDGSATNATLSLANSLDLTSYSSAELTFSWYIESGFDSGEYIALDLYDGNSWSEVRRIDGSSGWFPGPQENSWINETIAIDGSYLVSDFQLRFRAKVSSSSEDGFVDNVKVEGTLGNTEPVGLISHWTADNDAIDIVGNNDGMLVSGTAYASGQIGQAFSFDGVNDRVLVADSPSLRLTKSMTIEGWIKADSIPVQGQQGEIFFRGDDRGGLDPYSLSIQPDGRLRYEVTSLTDAASIWAPMPIGEFVHVAATLDDASGSMRLYLNGELMSQTTTTVRPFGNLNPGSNPGIGIGNHGGYPNTLHNFPFDGLIDDLKIYDVPLSSLEILENFYVGNGSFQPSISIDDVSVVEGESGYDFTDAFVSAGDGGLSSPFGIVFGPDGNLYVSSNANDSILRYDGTTGAFIDVFVTSGDGGLDNPRDLEFHNGDLFVASVLTNSVLRFDGTTGAFIDAFVAMGSGGLDQPRGLLFGTNNDLYVTSAGEDDAVLRYNATTGAFMDEFVASGDNGMNNPTRVVIGPDGNFYVSSTNSSSNSILRYDSNGIFIDTFVGSGVGDLNGPTDIVFENGVMLVASVRGDSVLSYDQITGEFVGVLVSPSSGGLDNPISMLLDSEGHLYVGSSKTNEVLRFGETSSSMSTVSLSWPSPYVVTVNFETTDGSALGGSDYDSTTGTVTFVPGVTSQKILIPILEDANVEPDETFDVNLSSAINASIVDFSGEVTIVERRFSVDDVTIIEGDTTPHYRGGFVESATGNFNDLTFGPDGNLYASSGSSQGAINRYDGQTGDFLVPFVNDGRISGTRDIVFRNGHMYVGSEYTDEVLRYHATTGAYIDTFVASGSGGIDGPHGLAFGPDTNGDSIPELYVTGRNSFNVVRYDGATGQPLGALDTAGSGALSWPEGITIESNGVAYVASSGSSVVQKYDAVTDTYLGAITSSQLNTPKAVRFGPEDGLMYVASAGNNRILRFDGNGNFVDDFVPAGSGGMVNPYRLEFGPDGNLYVAALGTSRILRFGTDSEAVFTVTLSSPSSQSVTVDFTTNDGSATVGNDYTAVSGTLVFEPGVTTRTILVPTLDDAVFESTETFAVNLLASSGAGIQDNQGIATIVDDEVANVPPTASAGTDQTVSDGDASGSQSVMLSGSGSDSDGSIVTYAWTVGSTLLGSTASISPVLLVGTHTLTLTVTDNDGATGSDTVDVTILANQGPTADAGAALTVSDTDSSGSETVTLVGSGNDVDGTITTYQWTEGSTALGTSSTISPVFTVGTHVLTLTVTDNGGATASDSVVVTVEQPSSATALYVYDIRFESFWGGWYRRAIFEIRSDSNSDGQGSSADAVAPGVAITVQFDGRTYSGTTDSNGLFASSWLRNVSSGTYAEVVDLALSDFNWDPLALDLEDDTDGDGLPDATV